MNKKLLSVLCVCALMLAIIMPSQAATGYQGYAVYRDGVYDFDENLEWHTAIMVQPDKNGTLPVAHSRMPSGGTELGTWQRFLDGYTSRGCYRPIPNMTDSRRNAVVGTARQLAASNIEYTFLNQMTYDNGYNPEGKTTVEASDIYKMRCDGFVEYSYEFNGIRIFGSDSLWNISKWGFDYMNAHGNWQITPKSQAENYMQFVGDI